jgi:biotin/methionine sulfoxide reductase
MLPQAKRKTVATHWGTYRAFRSETQKAELRAYEGDPDPSPIANAMIAALDHPCRIQAPMIRKSFYERGKDATGAGRGSESFVQVEWADAFEIVAREIDRVRSTYGNAAIYGGSYGWASAGRFHHAQSQVHRFLNCVGGYTRSFSNYSHAAADVIVPHVIGDRRGLHTDHTPWSIIIENTKLVVMFGGTSHKNAQVSSGGISAHTLRASLAACRRAGADFVSISPIRDDTMVEFEARWVPLRPTTDVALMLGIAHTLIMENLHDQAFLDRYTVGFERLRAYLTGESDGIAKSCEWAAKICEIPAVEITALARRMASQRTFIMMSWSLQRSQHGEQPYWMAITLAAMLGQIGLPGGGFGFGYASVNGIGNAVHDFTWPSLPQGQNAVSDFIPVARITDMLERPGTPYEFNGQKRLYPHARLVYWGGGNPFHHHQDLNRFVQAWKKPEVIVVHDSWWNPLTRHADIVLPCATALERNDIACSTRDRMIVASHKIADAPGDARTDYEIFTGIAESLGVADAFTEGRDEEEWLRYLYLVAQQRVAAIDLRLPTFDTLWEEGVVLLPEPENHQPLLHDFRDNPAGRVLQTPSGKIEIFSERIESFGYDDCLGHPAWLEPTEWLGGSMARRFPLHLISNQPSTKLHSQYDLGAHSQSTRIDGREPVRINPRDAAARDIENGDFVRLFNDRGECLAGAVISDAVRPGVLQISTGAWFDPEIPGQRSLEKHGNPNVLTADRGTSRLAQATTAHSCLVEVEKFTEPLPSLTCYIAPQIVQKSKRKRA